ncbi:DUF4238 domain-containing protein [Curtobacterium sp. Csp2]|uniref:DUF4238 domain-containing protein n=1 Tax=Curtobacterium sp. Csp2 TaxID=2495430 RepID=UPI0015803306|nr:DUF4238 domain-containing protein [Curtobacterium sp. Csp2]QKS17888.1 DUF4238 domain-containing protein [Curtobacterium sp. Csp2]
MNRPVEKRAHMVSKGYIKAWADSRKAVEVIDKVRNYGYVDSYNNATVWSFAYEPQVLTHDLEKEYGVVESRGLRVIRKLRQAQYDLADDERVALIAFLDMHLNRGRYADQVGVQTSAVALRTDGTSEQVQLNTADRMLLSRSEERLVRLAALGVEHWQLTIEEWPQMLVTGDGAVLLWRDANGSGVGTVTFPLSPSLLLVLGPRLDYPDNFQLNALVAANSRRWLIGQRRTLRMGDLGDAGQQPADDSPSHS